MGVLEIGFDDLENKVYIRNPCTGAIVYISREGLGGVIEHLIELKVKFQPQPLPRPAMLGDEDDDDKDWWAGYGI